MLVMDRVAEGELLKKRNPVGIGLAGFGTVGTGVLKVLSQNPAISIQSIVVRDLQKPRNVCPEMVLPRLTQDFNSLIEDPAVEVIVEVMGGVGDAKDLVFKALEQKKHVVTSNKELIAKHGPELFELASRQGVRLLFEGAVAGGIPILMPLQLSLAANQIQEMAGILNGTTNYILTQMSQEGLEFEEALQQAQAKGFAEADPSSDVEGMDAAYKISILASLAFHKWVNPQEVYRQGISSITACDIENAGALGYTIKLLGFARPFGDDGTLDVRVHPMLVPHSHPLANIHLENNAVWVKGDAVGAVMFSGKGAGELPTASAVAGDVLAIAHDLLRGNDPIPSLETRYQGQAKLLPITQTQNKYYIRLSTLDRAGVIGNLGKACGEFGVSLESIMQKGIDPHAETASIVLITQAVSENQMRQALDRMLRQETTHEVACLLRVL